MKNHIYLFVFEHYILTSVTYSVEFSYYRPRNPDFGDFALVLLGNFNARNTQSELEPN